MRILLACVAAVLLADQERMTEAKARNAILDDQTCRSYANIERLGGSVTYLSPFHLLTINQKVTVAIGVATCVSDGTIAFVAKRRAYSETHLVRSAPSSLLRGNIPYPVWAITPALWRKTADDAFRVFFISTIETPRLPPFLGSTVHELEIRQQLPDPVFQRQVETRLE